MKLEFEKKAKAAEEHRNKDLIKRLNNHNEAEELRGAIKEREEAAPELDEDFDLILEDADDEDPITGLPATASVSVAIPQEMVEAVAAMADDQTLWVKVTQFGFSYGEKVVPEIRGRMIQIKPYLIKFEGTGKPPIKKPHVADEKDIPEGFERRCDIKIDVGNWQIIGVSLSKSSFLFGLAPYLKSLINQGLNPSDVITVMQTRGVTNQKGQFAVVNFFYIADDTSPLDPAPAEVVHQAATQSANNPWA